LRRKHKAQNNPEESDNITDKRNRKVSVDDAMVDDKSTMAAIVQHIQVITG
jgi:hypothetical protein